MYLLTAHCCRSSVAGSNVEPFTAKSVTDVGWSWRDARVEAIFNDYEVVVTITHQILRNAGSCCGSAY